MGLKPRILIADDEPLTLELIVERLQAEGYEVEVVSDGHEAIEASQEEQLQSGPYRSLDAGHERDASPGALCQAFPGNAGDRSYRIWNHRNGGRSDEARRLRLSLKARKPGRDRPDVEKGHRA